MVDIKNLATEQRNSNTQNIDKLDTLGVVRLINSEDKKVADAVEGVLPIIAEAIDVIYANIKAGGRLVYVGAGTSGRLGLLDAVECPPTFGVDYSLVTALMAGGNNAFVKAIEGAEDNEELGGKDLADINFNKNDTLVGIAASGRTPYVIGALKYARSLNASTISLTCAPDSETAKYADFDITVQPGPEVLTGSTRLKSGTAQKMVLNMLSTVTMIKLGKTYGNLMVDLKATNEKLISRAVNIVNMATGAGDEMVIKALESCDYSAKTAILMILADADSTTAQEALAKNEDRIYLALEALK